MTDATLLCAMTGPVLTVTLNRPRKLNALNSAMIAELVNVLDVAEADASVRAIVVTGAGRAFSAGADIAEFEPWVIAGSEVAGREFVRPGQDLTRRIESYRKPVIAAVNGLAFGGGCEIVEAMHLAVAARSATFSKAEIDIGIIPVFGGTQRLPRHVGKKLAHELILTGKVISAHDALIHGLINRIVEDGEELAAAIELGKEIAGKSPTAISAALLAINRGLNASIDEGLLIEAAAFEQVANSDVTRHQIARFTSRKLPVRSA